MAKQIVLKVKDMNEYYKLYEKVPEGYDFTTTDDLQAATVMTRSKFNRLCRRDPELRAILADMFVPQSVELREII